MTRRRSPMQGAPRSEICPFVPGEAAGDRHQRRMETAVEMEARARRELNDRDPDLVLVVHAGGSHWQVKEGRRIVAQWWPQSGRFVPGERYGEARKAHDVEQMLRLIGELLEQE